MADDPRYYVQSERVRGEARLYWVCDRTLSPWRGRNAVTGATIYKNHAERECRRLNEEASALLD